MAAAKPNPIVRVEYEGKEYALDVNDLDGYEMGTLERMRARHGDGIGSLYGALLLARRRDGETDLTEDQVMRIKWGDMADKTREADARPPEAGPAENAPG